MRRPATAALLTLLLLGVAATTLVQRGTSPAVRPAPTELGGGENAEEELHRGRKEWIRSMHRGPPETDWRAVETENGEKQVLRRLHLAASPPAPASERWEERGSDNQAGRVWDVTASSDGLSLYAGTDLGGLWIGGTDGTDWRPLGDNLYGGAHWVVSLPAPDGGPVDTVLVATNGGQIHRSDDDGPSWTVPGGLPTLASIRRLVRTSDGTDTVFLLGGTGRSAGYAIYRSTDGGSSFVDVFDLGGYAGDVWVPRTGGSAIYLLSDNAVFTSEDGGGSWVAGGDAGTSDSTGVLVGSEAGGPTLWAALSSGRTDVLYRSDSAGTAWTEVTDISDWYGMIGTSTVDENLVAWGGVELHVSHDGAHFSSINGWADYYDDPPTKLHADLWRMQAVPDGAGGETWYLGSDGGLFASFDGLETVQNLSTRGLRVGQYYSTLTSAADPTHVAVGAQDQGYQLSNGVPQDDNLLELATVVVPAMRPT